MRKFIWLFMATSLMAQVSPPSNQSRVAGRFVAYSYSQWSVQLTNTTPGTGTKQFTVSSAGVKLSDGRVIMPFSTTAPIVVGSETITPSAIGNQCVVNNLQPNTCTITATFAQQHFQGERIYSATYGLQEALNDAGTSGGGTVVIDSAWTNLGGTNGMIAAATLPANTQVEDMRKGTNISGQTTNCVPKATGASSLGATSAICDDGTIITTTEPFSIQGTNPSLKLGTGTGDQTGLFMAPCTNYGGPSGYFCVWATGVTPTSANWLILTNATGEDVRLQSLGGLSLGTNNITRMSMDSTNITTHLPFLGDATAPTGACSSSTGAWSFTQDGKISYCKAGTWEVVTIAP